MRKTDETPARQVRPDRPARHPLARLGLRAGAITLALYAAACLWLYVKQGALLYYPVPAASLADVRELPGRGVRVAYSGRDARGPDALVYFGGNAEDVSRTRDALAEAFPRHALYLLHYRGYGASAGVPSETVLRGDALALYDLAQARHRRVVLVGRSLGSGLAVQVAARRNPARVVLVTPYDSIAAVGQGHFPWLPVALIARDRYDSAALAARIRAPTLLLVAGADTVVPRVHGERLRARFRPGVAAWRVVDGAGHNDISARADYFAGWDVP